MVFLYNLGIYLYTLLIRLASLKNSKAKAWLTGRNHLLKKIENEIDAKVRYTWFHFASLGEFEQGRPVIEHLKAQQAEIHILITFFSPSGYQICKNYPLADHVFYLPVDTAFNAKEFIRLTKPVIAIFTKYEYWYHYFNELQKNHIPLYIIAAIFRKSEPFFQWYGVLHRIMLRYVAHFFVQNEESVFLLNTLSIYNVTISGDTRFDRVAENSLRPRSFDAIKAFCEDAQVIIAGSTWPEDEQMLALLITKYSNWKLIIAPHEIGEHRIRFIEQLVPSVRYSLLKVNYATSLSSASVLIIDNIGMLSSLYQYGHIAYIGGGFGSGIHNTLEPAAFGLPILFGPRYHKFQEAKDMINLGAAFSFSNQAELNLVFNKVAASDYLIKYGQIAKQYVQNHTGATACIVNKLYHI